MVIFIYEQDDKLFSNFLPYVIIPVLITIFSGYFQVISTTYWHEYMQITGIFRDEKILGSYLSRIAPIIFSLFLINREFFNNIKYKIFLMIFVFLLFILVVISGERTATVNLITISLLIAVFNLGYLRKFIIFSIALIVILISLLYSTNSYKFRIINKTIEYSGLSQSQLLFFSDHHHLHMLSAVAIFKDNILFGSGPKTFRLKCSEPKYYRDKDNIYNEISINKLDRDNKIRINSLNGCSTHPHHIYLQLLSETGISGLVIFLFFIAYLIKKIFSIKENDDLNFFKLSLVFLILTNFSPFTPSGNLFNNYFLILLIIPIALFLASESKLKL